MPAIKRADQLVNGLRAARGKGDQPDKPDPLPGTAPEGASPFLLWKTRDKECHEALRSPEGKVVLDYLHARKFTDETIDFWKLGATFLPYAGSRVPFLTIPIPDEGGELTNMKFRSLPVDCPACRGAGCSQKWCDGGKIKKMFVRSPGRPSTLFGAHLLPDDLDSGIIVTEGELDVIAFWQYGLNRGVVSSVKGATGAWEESWLDMLEPYAHFTLAVDTDDAGEKGAVKLADQLGKDRCSRAKLPRKDAADCQQAEIPFETVEKALERASPMLGVQIVSAESYADAIEQLIARPDELIGIPTGSGKMDECVGGWRPELVIVTGDTGHGKTTWALWALREAALKGHNVLVTSFENRPIGAVIKLLRMELGGDFTDSKFTPQDRRMALDRISEHMLFVDHAGHLPAAELIATVRYAKRRRGVRLVLVDHAGFVLPADTDDERHGLEALARALTTVAAQDDLTIFLIAHPNRMHRAQQRRVQLGDLKGASGLEQDCATGLVIVRKKQSKGDARLRTVVYADKVRSEFGMGGSYATLYYDYEANRYADRHEDLPAARYVDPS